MSNPSEFFINEVNPYSFSFYTSRIEGSSEMKELLLSLPMIDSEYCKELIVKTVKDTIIYTQKTNSASEKGENKKTDATGRIMVYENQAIESFDGNLESLKMDQKEHFFDIKYNQHEFKNLARMFFLSCALSFVIFYKDDIFFCFSRVEDDINKMFVVFSLESELNVKSDKSSKSKNENMSLKRIFLNPSMLLDDYKLVNINQIANNNDLFQEDFSSKSFKGEKNFNMNNISKQKKDNNVIDEQINSYSNEKYQDHLSSIEMKPIETHEDDQLNRHIICEIPNSSNTENNIGSINLENSDQTLNSSNRNLFEQQKNNSIDKEYLIKEMDPKLKKELFNQTNNEQKIENSIQNVIKFGKVIKDALIYREEKFEVIISLDNYKKYLSIISLLVYNMKINDYDVIEIKSELDIFIRKDRELGFIFFLRDQVDSNDIDNVDSLSNLKNDLIDELKKLFKKVK